MRDLAERFVRQAAQCAEHGSPLTAELLRGAAAEMVVAGPVQDLLAPLAEDPPGTVPSLRLAAALHRLVLDRRAPRLALHYPTVGGTAGLDGVWAAAREVIASEPALTELVRLPVQTNEVGRAAALFGGLQHIIAATGLPVRLLEIGASAGLNLHVDRFAYDVGDRVLGAPDSAVRLEQPWSGALPPQVEVTLVARSGCDPAPLDPASDADRLTLTSCVWADQLARFERLRAALSIAGAHPVLLQRAPASAFLAEQLTEQVPGVATVVWHSVVWQYLTPEERAAVSEQIDQAGARATPRAPLAHLRLEPERVGESGTRFRVHLTTWPVGQRRHLADALGHGPPVTWH